MSKTSTSTSLLFCFSVVVFLKIYVRSIVFRNDPVKFFGYRCIVTGHPDIERCSTIARVENELVAMSAKLLQALLLASPNAPAPAASASTGHTFPCIFPKWAVGRQIEFVTSGLFCDNVRSDLVNPRVKTGFQMAASRSRDRPGMIKPSVFPKIRWLSSTASDRLISLCRATTSPTGLAH
jgi:hypothetical protein